MADLKDLLTQRHSSAMAYANAVAQGFGGDHRSGSMEQQLELEGALDDVARFERLLGSVSRSAGLRNNAPYAKVGGRSFFRDLDARQTNPDALGALTRHAAIEAERAQFEGRAVAAAGFGGFVPPTYLLSEMSTALRAASPLVDLIGQPLPELDETTHAGGGPAVVIAKFTTGAAASVVAENTAVSSVDIATTALTVPVGAVSATVSVSRVAVERGKVDGDVAAELFAALNAETERLVINGIAAGQVNAGLLQAAGTTPITYTNASPTAITALPKIGAALSASVNNFLRGPADVILSHPRFFHWLGSVGEVVEPPLDWDRMTFGADIVGSTAVPTNLGAGTNETRLITFPRAAVYCGITEPLVDKYYDSANAAGNATVVFVARRYCAFQVIWGSAVSVLGGSGMAAVAS
jgi:hypothetical protein